MRAVSLLSAMALLSLWPGAPARSETICKFTGANGAVSYAACGSAARHGGDAGTELSIDPDQNVISPERSAELEILEEKQRQHWNAQRHRQAQEQSHDQRIAAAEAELAAAEAALEAGLVTRPGDFIGKKGGGVRPSQQRYERLTALQTAVDDARARLEAVRSRRPGN